MLSNLSSLQILAVNADNATSNDTQGKTLAGMPNSFELENHVHCYNHPLQLSEKTLLCPFNAGLGKTTEDHDNNNVEGLSDEDIDQDAEDNEDNEDNEDSIAISPEVDGIDDGIDELKALEMDEHEEIMTDTSAVHETVTKVCVILLACM